MASEPLGKQCSLGLMSLGLPKIVHGAAVSFLLLELRYPREATAQEEGLCLAHGSGGSQAQIRQHNQSGVQ